MGFVERIKAWFKGEGGGDRRRSSRPSRREPPVPTTEIEQFIASREGVEAFMEPRTTLYSTTVLLVAADGEYLRRPIRDRAQAAEVCESAGVPLYDAARVGYPRRMRDFDRGIRRDTVDIDDLPPWPGDEPAEGEGR